jgi:hypothetical protein
LAIGGQQTPLGDRGLEDVVAIGQYGRPVDNAAVQWLPEDLRGQIRRHRARGRAEGGKSPCQLAGQCRELRRTGRGGLTGPVVDFLPEEAFCRSGNAFSRRPEGFGHRRNPRFSQIS